MTDDMTDDDGVTNERLYVLVVEGPADEAGERGVERVFGVFSSDLVIETQEEVRAEHSGEGVTVTAVRLETWHAGRAARVGSKRT